MHIIISNIVAQIDNNASGITYLDKRIKESNKMWLNVIGFILCLLGGGMISKVVARIDDNDKEVILCCFAIIFIMIGAMAMVLAL